ncbi:MAG: serine/threonine-protein kinase, partial [Myxococcaceae bacterium]
MDPNSTGREHVTRQRVGSITHLRIRGPIDETFSPQAISTDLLGHVILDLGRLERISSFGVRRWIEFVGRLPAGALGLYVIHAPPIVVDQLNMVEGFCGISRVLSVLAPYRCNACGEDRVRVVDVVKNAAALAENRAPEHNCGVCGGPLEFADTPEEFFDFIRTQSTGVPVEPVIERYLNSLRADAPHEGNSTAKLIEGDVTFFALGGVLKSDLNVRRLATGLEGRIIYDFGHVTKVEEGAIPRLGQILSSASEHARVFLWRVPPCVLDSLSKLPALKKVSITTLGVPSECSNCGERSVERIEAATYLDNLLSEEGLDRQCPICGGTARLAQLKEYVQQLMRMDMVAAPPEIEVLEQQALSQYLSSQNPETTPSGRGNNGEGSTPGSHLQILKRIGRGGMAEVFLARQKGVRGFEKYVVLKKVLGQFAQSTDFVEMLFAEARANARLTHPNIVQTFDVGMMDGMAYITMEYVRGPDMKRLSLALKRKNLKLPIEHALRVAAEIAAGLHYAHSYVDPEGKQHPMVHRDVSPHNILISLDGAIKLSDFGIAKVQGESDQTQAGVLKGKISYVSPEAVAGMPLDARNDVFGLGVVLFEMLTGQLPFKRDNDAATLRAIVREPAPNPSELDSRIPPEISHIILWALEKDPVRRIQSASALREAIEAAMVRCGWSSSPSSVAQFFREAIPQELVEFGPNTGSMVTPVPVPPNLTGGSGVLGLGGNSATYVVGHTPSRPRDSGSSSGRVAAGAVLD